VWSINNEDLPRTSWNHWTHYYPGDRYVDWVGLSGFNWGATQDWSSWKSLDDIIRDPYADYQRKPIIIIETGSVEQGGSKAAWLTNARYSLKRNFPAVKGFVYFNATDNQGAVWPVTTSRSALRAYRLMGHDPYWDAQH
jgi:beta-mannanase